MFLLGYSVGQQGRQAGYACLWLAKALSGTTVTAWMTSASPQLPLPEALLDFA